MPVGGQDHYHHLLVVNFINQAMFSSDSAAPLPCTVPRKRFWLTCASSWMLIKFSNQL